MKNIIVKLIILGFIPALFVSCREEIDFNIQGERDKIVVNSLFSSSEQFKVNVTQSISFNTEEVKDLDNASVLLYGNSNLMETLTYRKSPNDILGNYYSTIIPEKGVDYQLKVAVDGLGEVSSSSTLPSLVDILAKANWIPWGKDSSLIIRYDFDLTLKDPSEKNYYYLIMSFPLYVFNDATNQYDLYSKEQNVEILTGDLPDHQLYLDNGLLFNDDGFNGFEKRITGTATTTTFPCCYDQSNLIVDKRKLHIKLHSLSEDAYNFHSSYAKKLSSANDLYVESTVIYSNIENGLGIFAGENITVKDVEIKY